MWRLRIKSPNRLQVYAVKAPGLGDRRKAMLQGHRPSD
jgi:hypothetical protein